MYPLSEGKEKLMQKLQKAIDKINKTIKSAKKLTILLFSKVFSGCTRLKASPPEKPNATQAIKTHACPLETNII